MRDRLRSLLKRSSRVDSVWLLLEKVVPRCSQWERENWGRLNGAVTPEGTIEQLLGLERAGVVRRRDLRRNPRPWSWWRWGHLNCGWSEVGKSASRRLPARERSSATIGLGLSGRRCPPRGTPDLQHTPQTAGRKFGADSVGVGDFSSWGNKLIILSFY